MPRTIALFDMDIPIWLRPMLETEPNGLTGLSVAQLVQGWLLLHTVFELIYNRDTRGGIAEHATTSLHTDNLLEAFHLLGYPRQLARRVIEFFTYDWSRHEALWARPLVKVGPLYYPFLPSLMWPNMTRTLDLWLQRCKYTTSKGNTDTLLRLRGTIFEQHVRDTLGTHFREHPEWDAYVYPDSIAVRGSEIDLLWRVGATVFVGDAKFLKYPANPNEIGYYYRELEHGAVQARHRAILLEKERARAAALAQWAGDPQALAFQPLVVCGHAMGADLSYMGVPCIQVDMLEMLFRQDCFVMSGSLGGGPDDIVLPLPKTPDFSALIQFYLMHVPGIWFRQAAIRAVPVLCCQIGDMAVYFEHRAVHLPHSLERQRYCLERRAEWDAMLGLV
jgi:hypothetical protein